MFQYCVFDFFKMSLTSMWYVQEFLKLSQQKCFSILKALIDKNILKITMDNKFVYKKLFLRLCLTFKINCVTNL